MTGFHAVRFYESDESIGHIVTAFLGAGLVGEEPALVIATAERRAVVERHLRGASFCAATLEQSGRLLMLDAAAALSTVVVDGAPDPVRFGAITGALIARVGHTSHGPPRVYDEMVDMLWKADRREAAFRLETFWDRLVASHQCSVLCGHGPDRPGESAQVLCAEHTHVIAENGIPHPVARR